MEMAEIFSHLSPGRQEKICWGKIYDRETAAAVFVISFLKHFPFHSPYFLAAAEINQKLKSMSLLCQVPE